MSFDIAGSPLVVVCSPEQGLATKDAVSLLALAEVTLAGYPPGWGVRSLSDLALRSVGIEPHYAFEVNDTATLLDLVEAGLGVTIVPEAIAAPRRCAAAPAGTVSGRQWLWRVSVRALPPAPRTLRRAPSGRC